MLLLLTGHDLDVWTIRIITNGHVDEEILSFRSEEDPG